MTKLTSNDPKKSIRDVEVGQNVRIFDFVNMYECTLGDDTQVGTFVEIQRGVVIGKRCRIQSHTFICEGVTIEDEVFVGHGVMFINDKKPTMEKTLAKTWTMDAITIKKGVTIGTGAIIMGGITIGENAMIGAGAVVTKDVPENTTVIGVPARVLAINH